MTKQCAACSLHLPLSEFHADQSRSDNLNWCCKKCNCERGRNYRKNNPERRKATRQAYYQANCEKILEARRQWYRDNIEEVKAAAKQKRTGKKGYLKAMLQSAKARAKLKGWDFDLDIDYLMSIAPDYCPIDNKPFDWNRERELLGDGELSDHSTPSLDRTDSDKGYVKGNIAIIGDKWNRWKNNMQLNDLIVLTEYVRSVTKK